MYIYIEFKIITSQVNQHVNQSHEMKMSHDDQLRKNARFHVYEILVLSNKGTYPECKFCNTQMHST